jgi:WD40-like Beta Propeller Repeat
MKIVEHAMRTFGFLIFACYLTGCAQLSQSLGAEEARINVIYYAPAWGPNEKGEEVVYFLKQVTMESAKDEQNRVYFCSIKPDGSARKEIAWLWKAQPEQFIESYSTAAQMEINPATKRAAIGIEYGGRTGVFIVNLDGTGLTNVWPHEWTTNRPTNASYPTWSPDGKWIAFVEWRASKDGGYDYRHIVKCRPDGSGYIQLTKPDGYKINVEPAWSPATNVIAYVHYPNHYPGGRYLWLMDANGDDKRNTEVWGAEPRWSPDGKSILHQSDIVVDAASGKRVKVLKPYPPMFPKWGKIGYVSVGPDGISFTDLGITATRRILPNVSRSGRSQDIEKEGFRW